MDDKDRACALSIGKSLVGRTASDPYIKKLEVISRGPNTHTKGWCGDFVTFCLYKAGVRDCSILNRFDLCGRWVVGDNLARLYRWSVLTGSDLGPTQGRPGDILALVRPDGDHVGLIDSVIKNESGGVVAYMTVDGNSFFGKVAINKRTIAPGRIRRIIDVTRMGVSTSKQQLQMIGDMPSSTLAMVGQSTGYPRSPDPDGGDGNEEGAV